MRSSGREISFAKNGGPSLEHTEAIAEFNHTLQIINQQAKFSPNFIYFDFCPPISQKTGNIIIILQTNIKNIPQSRFSAEEFESYLLNKITTNQPLLPTDPGFTEVINYIFYQQQQFEIDSQKMIEEITQKYLALKAFHWVDHEIVFSYGENPFEIPLAINSMIQNQSFAILIQISELEAIYSWEHLLQPQLDYSNLKQSAESEIRTLTEDNQALKENLESCAEQIRNLETEANATKAKMFDLQEKTGRVETEFAELLTQRSDLEGKLGETEVLLNEMSKNLMTAQEKIQKSDTIYEEKIRQERANYQKMISDLEQKYDQMTALNENLKAQIQILESQLNNQTKETKELNSTVQEQQKLMKSQHLKIDSLTAEIVEKEQIIQDLNNSFAEMKQQTKNLIESNKVLTLEMLKSIKDAENQINS